MHPYFAAHFILSKASAARSKAPAPAAGPWLTSQAARQGGVRVGQKRTWGCVRFPGLHAPHAPQRSSSSGLARGWRARKREPPSPQPQLQSLQFSAKPIW